MNQFPLTLEAVKKSDGAQWAIGDALIAECGPPSENSIHDGSWDRLKQASQYLESQGFNYTTQALSYIRVTADAFCKSSRFADISWSAHRVAGTPEYLAAIVANAPKGVKGFKITQEYVVGIRSSQLADARAEREAAEDAAREEREKAEKAEAEARAIAQKAEAAEKTAAEAKLEKAKKKTAKAKAVEKEVKTAPKKKLVAPSNKEEQSDASLRSKFIANAMSSIRLAQESAKSLEGYISQLSPTSVRALTDCALEAANAWTDAANIVRGVTKNHSGHLSVVGE